MSTLATPYASAEASVSSCSVTIRSLIRTPRIDRPERSASRPASSTASGSAPRRFRASSSGRNVWYMPPRSAGLVQNLSGGDLRACFGERLRCPLQVLDPVCRAHLGADPGGTERDDRVREGGHVDPLAEQPLGQPAGEYRVADHDRDDR